MKTSRYTVHLIVLFTCLFVSKPVLAQTHIDADAIIGLWTNEDAAREIEFVKTGTTYEAIIKKAPDKNLVGKKQITGLEYHDGIYEKGRLFLPKRGKSFSCTARLINNTSIELSVDAGIMSKTQVWIRIK